MHAVSREAAGRHTLPPILSVLIVGIARCFRVERLTRRLHRVRWLLWPCLLVLLYLSLVTRRHRVNRRRMDRRYRQRPGR